MNTTSLKLPDELKCRLAVVAEQAQKSAHAFMVEAIAERVDDAEAHAAFVASALDSLAEVNAGGATFDGDEVHAWLRAKVRGEHAPAPKPMARLKRKSVASSR